MLAGLLANLTCIQAEMYQMEQNLSLSVDPLWVVPYSTVAIDYQNLLVEYDGYAQVGVCQIHAASIILYTCCQLCTKPL